MLWSKLSKKFLFAPYNYNDDSNFWGKKCSFASKKLAMSKKLPISNDESFLESVFDIK